MVCDVRKIRSVGGYALGTEVLGHAVLVPDEVSQVGELFQERCSDLLLLFADVCRYTLVDVIFPDSTVFLFGLVPMSARMLILGYTVLEIVYQMTGYNAGVAHLTHLGGFAFAYLYFVIRFRVNPAERLFGRRR